MQHYQMNISAPNLVNICVDETMDGEMSGRLYHCYSKEPDTFSNIVELICKMESLFDAISFPQASTKTRSFVEKATRPTVKPEKVADQREIIEKRGEKATFVTNIKFRQNSTWQGEMLWMEKENKIQFLNSLDFIKLLDEVVSNVSA